MTLRSTSRRARQRPAPRRGRTRSGSARTGTREVLTSAASLHQPPAIGDPRREDTAAEHHEEVPGMPQSIPTSQMSEHETSAKTHALIKRSASGDDLQPSGEGGRPAEKN